MANRLMDLKIRIVTLEHYSRIVGGAIAILRNCILSHRLYELHRI